MNIFQKFNFKPHAPIKHVNAYDSAYHIAIKANAHTFATGDMVYNARLNDYAQVIAVTAYPYAVFDCDGEYLGFGDTLGIEALYVGFEWADGNTASAYWLMQDVELLTDAHMAMIEGQVA